MLDPKLNASALERCTARALPTADAIRASRGKRPARSSSLGRLTALGLTVALSLSSAGCIKKILLEGQIASTRKGSAAIQSLHDWEIAEKAAMAGIAQIEGMRYLAPENEDALFMLTRSWASVALGFIEDELERVEDVEGSSSPQVDYLKRRTEAAYDRAVWYGQKLLGSRIEGFKEAQKNSDTMKAWLAQFEGPEDAEKLFWLGYAWMGRVNIAKERPEMVSELFIGVAMLERSVELDPTYMNGSGHVALGAYHARTPSAELDESKKHFDKALAIGGEKAYMAKVQLAVRYHCNKGDKASYEATLKEVLEGGDLDPYQRLPNTIAKRKAFRWMQPARMRDNCGF